MIAVAALRAKESNFIWLERGDAKSWTKAPTWHIVDKSNDTVVADRTVKQVPTLPAFA